MNKLHYIITCDFSKRPNVRTPVPSNGASPFAERMGPQCQSNLRDKNVFKPQQALVIFVKIIQFGETTKNLKRIGFVKMMGLETMENST